MHWHAGLALQLVLALSTATEGRPVSDVRERAAFQENVRNLIKVEQFGQLEDLAARLRKGRERFTSGSPKLYSFYVALESAFFLGEPANALEGRLKRWQTASPKSAIPPMVLSDLEVQKASDARGEGAAYTVTPEGWKGYEEHLALARAFAKQALGTGEKDPQLYCDLLDLCRNSSRPRSEAEQYLKAGLAIDPSYYELYADMANYLLPRWSGNVGDLEAFADQVLKERGHPSGDIAYIRIAGMAAWMERGAVRKQSPGLSWQKLKAGLVELNRAFPNSARNLNLFTLWATIYEDRPTARDAFLRLGPAWDDDAKAIWDDRNWFKRSYEWATRVSD
jgi:hypothetical protein